MARISGYFALETYPTDTAGFFTLFNRQKNIWIAADIDKFGTPMIVVFNNDKLSYYPVATQLLKFQWFNICLNIIIDFQFINKFLLPFSHSLSQNAE